MCFQRDVLYELPSLEFEPGPDSLRAALPQPQMLHELPADHADAPFICVPIAEGAYVGKELRYIG
jgi:hypothetical protein